MYVTQSLHSIIIPVNLTHRSERVSFRHPFLCLMLYIVITAMERMMAKGIALFTVMFMLVGCGAHVNISASAPKGKDLDITVKTTENN